MDAGFEPHPHMGVVEALNQQKNLINSYILDILYQSEKKKKKKRGVGVITP